MAGTARLAGSRTRGRARRPGLRAFTILCVGAMLWVVAAVPTSGALFSDSDFTTGSFAADILDPPSSLAASVSGSSVDLSWTASPDSYVTGYDVLRSTTSGSGYGSVGAAAGTNFTDGPLADGTYFYVARSTFASWTSVDSNEAVATLGGSSTTGEVTCTSNAANAGGDGNGYEVMPGNACADDSTFAADMNSGTSTALGCTAAGKDKHRFWGFGFGLPGSVTSIDDIDVRLDAALDALTGTNRLCVQLSWDGGASWTTAQYVPLSSAAETSYRLSGLWGRTWTAGQLSTTNFMVRVIDVSNVTTRDFFLDYVGVTVTYTP
jgi:hypothetical protein